MKINGLGISIWVAQKYDAINAAYELYEATQSNDALLDLAAKTSELVAGAAVGFLFDQAIGALLPTGLDRVFDSLKRDIPHGDYVKSQILYREIGGYAGGKASDLLIAELRDYVSRNRSLDGLFDLLQRGAVTNATNTSYRTATATRPPTARDPLAIDLDGDGIETVGITATPVLFDHNADNIKTGTGWVRPDDAWLVLDRNGNGTIDSGRELFGVDTVLSGTPGLDAVYASTGFEALRTLDTNNDNLFNAADAAFAQVQIWQDSNQDGISQNNELFTLAQKNIASIALNASTTDTTAANLFLGVNPFYREFTNSITLTAQAQDLPEMQGSGWVRDMAHHCASARQESKTTKTIATCASFTRPRVLSTHELKGPAQ